MCRKFWSMCCNIAWLAKLRSPWRSFYASKFTQNLLAKHQNHFAMHAIYKYSNPNIYIFHYIRDLETINPTSLYVVCFKRRMIRDNADTTFMSRWRIWPLQQPASPHSLWKITNTYTVSCVIKYKHMEGQSELIGKQSWNRGHFY